LPISIHQLSQGLSASLRYTSLRDFLFFSLFPSLMTPELCRSFLVFTDSKMFVVTAARSKTHSLVFLAIHETLNTCLNHFILNAFEEENSFSLSAL